MAMVLPTDAEGDRSGRPERREHRGTTTGEIRRAQGAFRDALVAFLGDPSTKTYGEMHAAGLDYLAFEREVLLPEAEGALASGSSYEALLENHFTLVRLLNAVVADSPASAELREDVHELRRALLAQADLTEQTLCRVRPLRPDR